MDACAWLLLPPLISVVPLKGEGWLRLYGVSRPLPTSPTFASLRGRLPLTIPALGCSEQILGGREVGLLAASSPREPSLTHPLS